jgi:hypothetical protein
VSTAVDYRQRVDDELDDMSPSELEKVYRAILFLKEEFFDTGEGRYYTDSWTRAEQEATEAYQQGNLKAYESVDEMMDDILSSDNDDA